MSSPPPVWAGLLALFVALCASIVLRALAAAIEDGPCREPDLQLPDGRKEFPGERYVKHRNAKARARHERARWGRRVVYPSTVSA